MALLFDHLNECGQRLIKRLYNGKQLIVDGAPKLIWDWSRVRIRGSSGGTGNFSKSYGVASPEFQRRMRTEEDQCKTKVPKVVRAKPPSLSSMSLQPPSWEPLMSLVEDIKFWSVHGAASPAKKKPRVDRTGKYL